MLADFEKCVGAIAEAIISQEGGPPEWRDHTATVSKFLIETQAKMPDYLRVAFHVLTLAFDAWSYPTAGQPFHRLSLQRRTDQIARWQASRLKFRQSFAGFYKTFTIFGLYSELYEQDYDLGSRDEQH
ncbi:hypothetical protein [Sinorhizobium sp. BG8]|uniref:hypothetical protein n=1 Tax=Sinorhizobium sp. BG8 TaxID=2613773 RepID=UPI00193DD263|nr:hypothetical protein [Sinorhizobium sp. BG8]QRM56085.1 hypothetical protein F3Y30_17250 [Sinorhizobium sp. BG8]